MMMKFRSVLILIKILMHKELIKFKLIQNNNYRQLFFQIKNIMKFKMLLIIKDNIKVF